MKKTIIIIIILIFTLIGCDKKSINNIKDNTSGNIIPVVIEDIVGSLNLLPVSVKNIDDTGYLVLVNLDYPLLFNFDNDEFVKVLDYVPTSPAGMQDMYLHPVAK